MESKEVIELRARLLDAERRVLQAERRELQAERRALAAERQSFMLEQEATWSQAETIERLSSRLSVLEKLFELKGDDTAKPAALQGAEEAEEVRLPWRRDTVARAVVELQKLHGTWSGTMTELLEVLEPVNATRNEFWPKTPHKLTRRIAQAAWVLKLKGVTVTKQGRSKMGNVFVITSSALVSEE